MRVGINSRLDTIQAGILLPKLAILDDEINMRNKLAESYSLQFFETAEVVEPKISEDKKSAWAQYTIICKNREKIKNKLEKNSIPSAVHYPLPLNRQPAVSDIKAYTPVSDKLAETVLSLPMHAYMSKDIEREIIATVLSD